MRRTLYIVIMLGLAAVIVYGLWKRRGGRR